MICTNSVYYYFDYFSKRYNSCLNCFYIHNKNVSVFCSHHSEKSKLRFPLYLIACKSNVLFLLDVGTNRKCLSYVLLARRRVPRCSNTEKSIS